MFEGERVKAYIFLSKPDTLRHLLLSFFDQLLVDIRNYRD